MLRGRAILTFSFKFVGLRNVVQHPIYEPPRAFVAVSFRQLDCLIDGDARRHVFHVQHLETAVASGKHVYCEKPLATNADHARQMSDAARKNGLITLVGFNYIQNPVHALALSTLRNGDLGEVRHARVFFKSDYMADPDMPHSWRNEKTRAGAGVIGDVGSHCLSYYFHLIGAKIEEVF